ncbi:uncharacterized protein TNIN_470461 [Trichonephila inaurata madagascariensis]|uniref:Uncharacterized protein n=1 Tax=Trichonephila inaurata madagascariensis TaxID=2747483 RepID=A0A8X7BYJ8_9ARAC|nr:uncharacterized protein TNIN_470461 [Trichonephila inaurata madagascariensis]
MKTFLLLVVALPCIVIADVRCPGGKICSSRQKCCKVNAEYECCDLDVEIAEREEKIHTYIAMESSFVPGYQNISGVTQNGYFDECTPWNCEGTCCTEDGCCRYKNAECCSSEKCCPSLNTCCNDGCCPYLSTCCEDGCCRQGYQCCNTGCCPSTSVCCGEKCCLHGSHCCNGRCCVAFSTCCGDECCTAGDQCCKTKCCPASSTCCGDTCCSEGEKCCNGWCCKKSQKCGSSSNTCINAAVVFSPAFTSLLMLVAGTFVSKSSFF